MVGLDSEVWKRLKDSIELGLDTFNGSIDVGALDVEAGGVVVVLIACPSKKFFPVALIKLLSEQIVHAPSLISEFPKQLFFSDELIANILDLFRVASAMPEDFLHKDEFGRGVLLTGIDDQKQ